MAKQLVSWHETDGRLFMSRTNAVPAETLAIFPIRKLYPMFPYMTPLQKHLTIYGIKQALADAGSGEPTANGKKIKALAKWELFLDGKIKAKKAGVVTKAKLLDALMTASPEESLKLLEQLRANAQA